MSSPPTTFAGAEVDPRPFAMGSGPLAALLLHGLTGTPYEVRPLAFALAEHGFAVRVPLLAGHQDVDSLEASTWQDWYASAQDALGQLHRDGAQRVLVVGFSMGGLLALRMAALAPQAVTALAALAVPLALPPWQRRAASVLAAVRSLGPLGKWVGRFPKSGPDLRIREAKETSPSLSAFPYPSLAQLIALQDEVDKLLPRVRAPLLVLHGRLDHTAPVADSARLTQRVGSQRVERVILPESFHILGLDLDRDLAGQHLLRFALCELGDPRVAPRPP